MSELARLRGSERYGVRDDDGAPFSLIGSRARSLRFALALRRKSRPLKSRHWRDFLTRLRSPPDKLQFVNTPKRGIYKLERETGLEPATSALARRRSTK